MNRPPPFSAWRLTSWLQRLAPSLTLHRQRYQFHPTFFGLVYVGMLLALLVGSINHNNNLGYLLTFLLGGILCVAIRHGYRNLRGITVLGGPAPPVFAGQQARFAIHLQPDGASRYNLLLALNQEHHVAASLEAGGSTHVALPVPATRRGLLAIDTLHLWTRYPLGLFAVRTRLPVTLSCTVFPQPLAAPLTRHEAGATGEHDPTPPRQAGRDFSGITPYRPGDSLQQVHWKSLAGGQGLHTKQFDEDDTGGSLFSLDRLPGTCLESKLSWLCHLIVTAEAQGLAYGLRLGDRTLAPGRGFGHRNRCLTALALHQ